MTAFSSPERTTSIRYALVSWPDFGEVGEVEGVTECSVEENMESTLKASGSMSLSGPWPGGLDDMVRVYSTSSAPGMPDEEVCHGTFMVSLPTSSHASGVETCDADLYSVLKVLQDTLLEDALSMDAGEPTVGFAASLVRGAGLTVISDGSQHRVSSAHSWDVGTDLLSVVNDCLGWANFSSADVDGYGNVVFRAYREPSDIEPSATLSDTERGGPICGVEVVREYDPAGVPNVSVVVYSPDEGEPQVAVVANDDPASEFSTVRRSRRITCFEEVNELAGSARDRALSNLKSKMRVVDKYEVDMLWWPCSTGDVLTIDYARDGIRADCSLVKRSYDMTPLLRCSCTFRRNVDYFEATEVS